MEIDNELGKTALRYLEKGFSIVPVSGKVSLVNWKLYQSKLPTKEEVEDWFFNLNPTGIAVVCGKISDIVVLDIEATQGDISNLPIPITPSVKSGGGGHHFYFRYPKSGSVKSVNLRQSLNIQGELRSDGNYVVLPPSLHLGTGNRYEWDISLEEMELADVPEWLTASKPKEEKVSNDSTNDWEEIIEGVSEGSRNTSATRIIGKLLRHIPAYNWDEMVLPMVQMINSRNQPPLPEAELERIYESLVEKEFARQASGANPTEEVSMEHEELKLKPVKVDELLIKELPEVQWTIDQLIPESGLAVLSAPPAHHKTWLALYFAIQVANGEMIFDRFSTNKCNVLFVEEDTNERLISSRVKKLSPTENKSSLYFLFRCGLKFDNPKMMDEFITFIKDNDIKFVVFDSLIQFHSRDENVNKDMAMVFAPLKKITNLGVSVLVLHHHRKESGDEDNMTWRDRSQSLRGASMMLSLLNSHLVVHRQSQNKSVLRQTKLWEREEMQPLEFELSDEGEKVVVKCLGLREQEKDKKTLAKEAILESLNEEHLTRNQLTEKLKELVSASIVANIISEMKRNKEILVVKKIGKNNRVEQYGLIDDDPDFEDKEEVNDEQTL